jgi:hypothetical protein
MRWLAGWVRDEDFWKQITVNTVSAGAVAVFAYVFAVGAGLIRRPEISAALPWAIALAAALVYTIISEIALRRIIVRMEGGGKSTDTLRLLLGFTRNLLLGAIMLGSTALAMSVVMSSL